MGSEMCIRDRSWNGRNIMNQGVGSGVYLIKYATPNEILTEKLLLLK